MKTEYIVGLGLIALGVGWYVLRTPAVPNGRSSATMSNPTYAGPPLGTSGNSSIANFATLLNAGANLANAGRSIYDSYEANS